MSLIRTLAFSLTIAGLFCFVLLGPLLGVPAWQELIIFAIFGIVFYFIFGSEDNLQSLSIVFISSSVLTTFGILSNAILKALTGNIISGPVPTGLEATHGVSQIATMFAIHSVILDLILLFVGIFGPAIAILTLKEKQKVDYWPLVRSAISATVLYIIAFVILNMIANRIVGVAGVG